MGQLRMKCSRRSSSSGTWEQQRCQCLAAHGADRTRVDHCWLCGAALRATRPPDRCFSSSSCRCMCAPPVARWALRPRLRPRSVPWACPPRRCAFQRSSEPCCIERSCTRMAAGFRIFEPDGARSQLAEQAPAAAGQHLSFPQRLSAPRTDRSNRRSPAAWQHCSWLHCCAARAFGRDRSGSQRGGGSARGSIAASGPPRV
jgi:hypothetical protein